MLSLSAATDVATIGAAVVAAISLIVAAHNTGITRRTNRALFWLDLRRMFAAHERIHRLLRPDGDWASNNLGPKPEEWPEVEAYLGLFEICEDLLAEGLIDDATFQKGYAYRIGNIVDNETIRREKPVKRAQYWTRFLSLATRMGIEVPST